MLQTSFDTASAIQAILSRAALANVYETPVSVYEPPADVVIGGLTIADIDEAASEVRTLLACEISLWKFF